MSLPQRVKKSFEPATAPLAPEMGADQRPQAPRPVEGGSRARRLFLPVAAALLFLGTLAAAGVWWHFQSSHLVTRNALVRSHLSELGVRGEGIIAQVFVDAGDKVRAGDLLAQLDNRHLLAQRSEVEARLRTLDEQLRVDNVSLEVAREKAEVALLRAQSEYRQMRAKAEAARVQAEDSKAFHAAREVLRPEGAISAEVLRDAAAKAAMRASLAEAADAAASGSFSDLRAAGIAQEEVRVREGELRVLEAKRGELQAQRRRIDADIESTRILAPADGAVIRRLAQPGMAVNTGMPLLSLWFTRDTWIEAWVPEESLESLRPGNEVTVTFPALPSERFSGRLERIGLATDFEMPLDYLPQTRETRMRPTPQIGVLIRLAAPPETLRPGLSAIVDIQREEV